MKLAALVLVVSGTVLVGASFAYAEEPASACGDLNGDATVNITDAVYLLNHLFLGADAPVCSVVELPEEEPSCGSLSRKVREACKHDALAEYWLASAHCDSLTERAAVDACREEAKEELRSALEECEEQLESRLDLCAILGESPYSVAVDPQDFVETIDNPYFPLPVGLKLVYESRGDEGVRRMEVSATSETREILGVRCVVVRERETLDGEIVEETDVWYAQDTERNVWGFGERSFEYEGTEIVDWQQWQAGVGGAKPGIVMKGNPLPGDVYYQEFVLGVSEDVGEVLSDSESVRLTASGLGVFDDCVQIAESSLLENELEHKYFAPGTGKILEVDLENGERTELVQKTVESGS